MSPALARTVIACAVTGLLGLGLPVGVSAGAVTDVGRALESGQAQQIQSRKNLENEAQQARDAHEKDRIAAEAAAEYRAQTTGVSQVPGAAGASGCFPTGARPQAHPHLTGLNAAEVPDGPPRDQNRRLAENLPTTVEGLFSPLAPAGDEGGAGSTSSDAGADIDWLVAGITVPHPPEKPPEIDLDTASPAQLAWVAKYNTTALRASIATDALEAVLSRPAPEDQHKDSELSRYTDAEWHVWLSVTTEEGAWRAITELQGHAIAIESRRRVLFERLLGVQATRLAVRMDEGVNDLNSLRAAAVRQQTETQ